MSTLIISNPDLVYKMGQFFYDLAVRLDRLPTFEEFKNYLMLNHFISQKGILNQI